MTVQRASGTFCDGEPVIDLRSIPIWERANRVVDEIEQLGHGASFTYLTEIDPRALIAHIQMEYADSFAFDVRRLGDQEWQITVECVADDRDGDACSAAFSRNAALALLGQRARAELLACAQERAFRKGEIIYPEDSAISALSLVLSGTIGVFAGAGEREQLLFTRSKAELFGDIELLDDGYSVGKPVVLSRHALVAEIPFAQVRAIFDGEPAFVRLLARMTAQHTRALAAMLADHVQHPIVARMAIALMPFAVPGRGLHPALPPLPTMTQTQLAFAAGTVKEVAARAIAELERGGAIRREHGHIAYLDRVKLLEIIGPD